jgi:hypothetical protein
VKRMSGRVAAAVSCALALLAFGAASALAAERHQDGDESLELRESLAAFFGPRSAPATTVNPNAFAAAVTTADAVPSTTPDGRLLIGTHGRGIWDIPVSALG